MKIFISSVMHGQKTRDKAFLYEMHEDRYIVRDVIRSMGCEPEMFEEFGAEPHSGAQTWEDRLLDSDMVVFLLWQSISRQVEEEFEKAWHFGKPRLVFKKRCEDKERESTKLSNFTKTIRDNTLGLKYVSYATREELRQFVRKSIVDYATHSIRNSAYRDPNRENMYAEAASIAASSTNRLCIAQRSPSCILPSKYPKDKTAYNAERQLIKVLDRWIKDIRDGGAPKLVLLGAKDQTLKEFSDIKNSTVRKGIIRRITELQNLANRHPDNLRIGWTQTYRKMYLASSGEHRYALFMNNPSTGADVAFMAGNNKALAAAIHADVEKTISSTSNDITTESIIREMRTIHNKLTQREARQ